MWGYSNKSLTQKRALTQSCWPPELGLLASISVSNEFLLFVSHPVCGVLSWRSERTKTAGRQRRTVLPGRRGLLIQSYYLEHFLDHPVGRKSPSRAWQPQWAEETRFGEADTAHLRGRILEEEYRSSVLVLSWMSCPGIAWNSVKPRKEWPECV